MLAQNGQKHDAHQSNSKLQKSKTKYTKDEVETLKLKQNNKNRNYKTIVVEILKYRSRD